MNHTQEELESPEVFQRNLMEALQNADDGHLKRASESSSKMVRRRIRENGFGRLVLPFDPVVDADLNQMIGTELPVIIEEMEPLSPGAKAISFNDTADTAFYRGDKLRRIRPCISVIWLKCFRARGHRHFAWAHPKALR
jgi:hypothetical protein